jgi:hypothetical protein
MPFFLPRKILHSFSLYCIHKDNYWRVKNNRHTGIRVKGAVAKISGSEENQDAKAQQLQDLELRSYALGQNFTAAMKEMFKSGTQIRNVTAFFKAMYESEQDSEQQLYFFLSLQFTTKKIFLKLVNQWKLWRSAYSGDIDEYCCVAYFYMKRCGEEGTFDVKTLRKKRKFRHDGRTLNCEELAEKYSFERLNFSEMFVKDEEIPFIPFKESGLRFLTPVLKDAIEEMFEVRWFTDYAILDLTPKSLFFICLASEPIPKMKVALLNAPFEWEVAQLIYPKVWLAYTEQKIEELVFIGMNNWTSKQTHRSAPDWFKVSWPWMEPFLPWIDLKYTPQGLNFKDGVTGKEVKGCGYTCCVVHCKRHPPLGNLNSIIKSFL